MSEIALKKKAWYVWHDGLIDPCDPEKYGCIEEITPTYANDRADAKRLIWSDFYDYPLPNGNAPEFIDIKAKRAKYWDIIVVDGQETKRGWYEEKLKDQEVKQDRLKKLQELPDTAYYIQAIDKGYVGNSVLFWGKGSAGYYTDPNKCQRYTKSEMIDICLSRDCIPWTVDQIDVCITSHVDHQKLDRLKNKLR